MRATETSLNANPGVGTLASNTVFLRVTTASGQFLYRVGADGNTSNVYTSKGSRGIIVPGVAGDNNVCVTDSQSPCGRQLIVEAPLAGGVAIALHNDPCDYQMVGSNDTVLFLVSNSSSVGNCPNTYSTLASLPVGAASSSITVIGSYSSYGALRAILAGPAGNLPASVALEEGDPNPAAAAPTSGVISPDGTALQPLNPTRAG
jgi:hypothetical protein